MSDEKNPPEENNKPQLDPPIIGFDPAYPLSLMRIMGEGIMRQSEQVEALNHPAPGSRPLPPSEFVRRFLEVEPPDARLRFRPGDKIKTTRRDLWGYIPEGAEGEVIRLEHPTHPMSLKGRHYVVMFDLSAYNLPVPDGWGESVNIGTPDANPTLASIQINCAALDLAMVEKGDNWGQDYKFEHQLDGIQWAMEHMTPTDWATNLEAIAENLVKGAPPRSPGMSDKWAKEFFKDSALPPMHEFTPAEWVKLLATNPQPKDLEPIKEKLLGQIQDYIEGLSELTPEQDRLHLNIVHEWDRRERLEAQNPPTDSE